MKAASPRWVNGGWDVTDDDIPLSLAMRIRYGYRVDERLCIRMPGLAVYELAGSLFDNFPQVHDCDPI